MKRIEGDTDGWVGSVFTVGEIPALFYVAADITQSVLLFEGSPVLCYKVDKTPEYKIYFLDLVYNQRLVAVPWTGALLEVMV